MATAGQLNDNSGTSAGVACRSSRRTTVSSTKWIALVTPATTVTSASATRVWVRFSGARRA